jgi:hypothetical protein
MEMISRRNLLAASGGAAAVGALALPGIAAAQQPRPVPGFTWWVFKLDLVIDLASGDAARQAAAGSTVPPSGPFYVTGRFYKEGDVNRDGSLRSGAMQLGVYRSWGWGYNPVTGEALSMHEFDWFGKGKLLAAGTTDTSVPVTGGTGDYKQVRGEVRADIMSASAGAYRLEFELEAPTGAR